MNIILGLLWAGWLSALFMIAAPVLAEKRAEPQQGPTILSFLISATNKISVNVTIPDRFTPIAGSDKLSEAIKNGLIEFIPKKEQNFSKWSELLTIIPLNNSGIQAHTFRNSVLGELKDKTQAFTMVNSAFKNEAGYQVATAIARYQLDGRTEILYFYAISGSVNSVSIQYIRAISPKEDLAKLLNELSAFFAKQVSVIQQ